MLTDALDARSADAERWAAIARLREAARGASVVIRTAHVARDFGGYAGLSYAALLAMPCECEDLLALVARLLRRPAISVGAAGGGRGPDRGGPGPPGGDLSPPSGDHREGVL